MLSSLEVSVSLSPAQTCTTPSLKEASSTPLATASPAQHHAQRVAIVGAGAVGSYYGARLWQAGHDVQFHRRTLPPPNKGLSVQSAAGDFEIPADQWRVQTATSAMTPADWILVAFKSTALSELPTLLRPLVHPPACFALDKGVEHKLQLRTTRVILIINGLVDEDALELLRNAPYYDETTSDSKDTDTIAISPGQTGEERHPSLLDCVETVYGGMAFICSNRTSPWEIHHIFGGLLAAGVAWNRSFASNGNDTNGNSLDCHNAKAKDELEGLFSCSKVPIQWEANLLRGRWVKMVYNLPFNGISTAMGGISIDQIVQDPSLRKLAFQIMDETITIANAELLGQSTTKTDVELLGDTEKNRMMAISDGIGFYQTSTTLDLIHRRPLEVRYLFQEPLERAKRYRVEVPRLQTVVALIEAHQRQHGL